MWINLYPFSVYVCEDSRYWLTCLFRKSNLSKSIRVLSYVIALNMLTSSVFCLISDYTKIAFVDGPFCYWFRIKQMYLKCFEYLNNIWGLTVTLVPVAELICLSSSLFKEKSIILTSIAWERVCVYSFVVNAWKDYCMTYLFFMILLH